MLEKMSSARQEDAGTKFWRIPELVERLIPFLDGHTTLSLVKALPLALEIIERKFTWSKFVRRVCPHMTYDVIPDEVEFEEAVAKERGEVTTLLEFLKMMENPIPHLLDLLHVICDHFPPIDRDDVPVEVRGPPDSVNTIPGPESIQVSCSCGHTHAVSPYALWSEEICFATK